jgi:hypothetical protein
MNVNRMRITTFTRKLTISLRRISCLNEPSNWNSYYGDEEEIIDHSLAPGQEAGQFAFGSNVDASTQEGFNFADDVNMS